MAKKKIFSDEWKDIRLSKETAKKLLLYKVHNDLLTYDQAINLMFDRLGEKF